MTVAHSHQTYSLSNSFPEVSSQTQMPSLWRWILKNSTSTLQWKYTNTPIFKWQIWWKMWLMNTSSTTNSPTKFMCIWRYGKECMVLLIQVSLHIIFCMNGFTSMNTNKINEFPASGHMSFYQYLFFGSRWLWSWGIVSAQMPTFIHALSF